MGKPNNKELKMNQITEKEEILIHEGIQQACDGTKYSKEDFDYKVSDLEPINPMLIRPGIVLIPASDQEITLTHKSSKIVQTYPYLRYPWVALFHEDLKKSFFNS
jgi:hypothetical protein